MTQGLRAEQVEQVPLPTAPVKVTDPGNDELLDELDDDEELDELDELDDEELDELDDDELDEEELLLEEELLDDEDDDELDDEGNQWRSTMPAEVHCSTTTMRYWLGKPRCIRSFQRHR